MESPEETRAKPWFAINGDKNLRVDYDLSGTSLVYDIGGYKGDWAREIYKKYRCKVEVFEPVSSFVKILQKEFGNNSKIKIHDFGLAGKNANVEIGLEEASSSTFKTSDKTENIKLVAASKFIGKNDKIDLMKINIEGGEYSLLDDLINSGLIKNITDIQIQFHIFVPQAPQKRRRLQTNLAKTHYLTYSYPWIWENWRRR